MAFHKIITRHARKQENTGHKEEGKKQLYDILERGKLDAVKRSVVARDSGEERMN